MRKPRKRPIKVGDTLYLWWKSRSKYESEYLGRATCIDVKRVTLADVWKDEENAKADGFDTLKEFRDWFAGKSWEKAEEWELEDFLKHQEYDIIKWKWRSIYRQLSL